MAPGASILGPGRAGIGLLKCLANAPPWLGRAVGALMGFLLWHALRGRRKVARRNLELCFPELSAAARETLLRDSMRSVGLGGYEFVRAWWGPPIHESYTLSGLEHLEAERAKGRGILLLSGHFLTLELCGRMLCRHIPLAGMYRRHKQPALERAVKAGRLGYADAMFAREELRAAVKYVKRGGILWYAPDQDMRGKDAVFAPFFGIPASTITATHQMAKLTGAAVLPFFHRRGPDGSYVLRIGPALDSFPSDDAVADTARVNGLIEAMVREAPAEYLWIHKRFKSRPAGEISVY
ncbi:MAG: lipid A biosynthesis lauroyl acyltransferase [Ahniella sp.]|nr:lipid A biosynthesis lauroyl acyltransferase [Ahniella sp.]